MSGYEADVAAMAEQAFDPPPFYVPSRTDNVQISRIRRHFGDLDARAVRLPRQLRFVFMCFTQRCGSTYLAQLIGSNRRYNVPREYLNYEHVIRRSTRRGLPSFADYVSDLVRCDARKGRMFVKITPLHLGLLQESGLLPQLLGRSDFILIERADKLAQAISFAIARETGRYTSNMDSRKSERDLVYDRDAIDRMLLALTEWYRQFDLFFGMNGLVPVGVTYERLVADPAASLGMIAAHLGLPEFVVRSERIRNARQASSVNAEWRERFLRGEGLRAVIDGYPAPERPRSVAPSYAYAAISA